ncbi:protein obstructor-E-like [Oratosquilla oratoria]|uniref:protein obstructor-E-like n=1 Tax=Oratosquilla oratoria TaxID=337810 RepID=UPI003F770261
MQSYALLLLCAGAAYAQFTCTDNGFYPDPKQCDKYYDCNRGEMTEMLCPDGLVFDSSLSPAVQQCTYPFMVQCPENSILQPPQPSGIECPRMNGLFEHEEPSNCQSYYECRNGEFERRACHDGLVFDEYTGTCQWENAGYRSGCRAHKESLSDGFSCPNQTVFASNGHEQVHPRYPKDNDCRYFYVCFQGRHPRISGCPQGTVFNPGKLSCDDPLNVPGCEHEADYEIALPLGK